MSPNVGNFVHDLVEMAKAMEELPAVREELGKALTANDRLAGTVMDRESTIQRLKAEIETHLATIRRVEVERDNAEIMFLELDERTHKVLANVKNAMDQLDQAVTSLDPPKPQPVPAVSEAMAVSSPEPFQGVTVRTIDPFTQPGSSEWINGNYDAPQGQSESDPTPAPTQTSTQSDPTNTAVSTAASVEPLPTPAPTAEPSATPNDAPSVPVTPEDATSTGTVVAVDDVGYHNEPPYHNNGDWAEWDAWAARMNTRYGLVWPSRLATA